MPRCVGPLMGQSPPPGFLPPPRPSLGGLEYRSLPAVAAALARVLELVDVTVLALVQRTLFLARPVLVDDRAARPVGARPPPSWLSRPTSCPSARRAPRARPCSSAASPCFPRRTPRWPWRPCSSCLPCSRMPCARSPPYLVLGRTRFCVRRSGSPAAPPPRAAPPMSRPCPW